MKADCSWEKPTFLWYWRVCSCQPLMSVKSVTCKMSFTFREHRKVVATRASVEVPISWYSTWGIEDTRPSGVFCKDCWGKGHLGWWQAQWKSYHQTRNCLALAAPAEWLGSVHSLFPLPTLAELGLAQVVSSLPCASWWCAWPLSWLPWTALRTKNTKEDHKWWTQPAWWSFGRWFFFAKGRPLGSHMFHSKKIRLVVNVGL